MRPIFWALMLGLVALSCPPAQARRPYPEHPAERLSPELKQRVWKVGARHLTLDDRALASKLAATPGLAELTRWSASEVQRLRTVGALPTVPKRNELLATLSARILTQQPRSMSLEEAVKKVAAQQPGVTVESLTYMARYDSHLAKAILARLDRGTRPDERPVTLTTSQAKELPLSRVLLEKILSRPGSDTVARLRGALERVDRSLGNRSRQIAPDRHIDQSNDPELQGVMTEVYRQIHGRRTLSIEQIVDLLPRAIIAAAVPRDTRWGPAAPKPPALRELHALVATEAVRVLAADYRAKVIDGPLAPENFREAWAITPRHWTKIMGGLPGQFVPVEKLPLDDRRLDAVSGAYRQLLAGELSSKAFYLRTGVGSDQLALLQSADPRRFPRPEGAPVWQPIARGHDRRAAANNIERLEEALAKLPDEPASTKEALRAAGVSQAQFDRLKRAERVSSPVAVRPPSKTPEQARLLGARATSIFERALFVSPADIVRELNQDPAFVARIGGRLSVTRYQQLRALASDRFPPLAHGPENERAVSAILAAEVAAVKRSGGSLGIKDLTAALQKKHPGLKPHRLERLRKAEPELFKTAVAAPRESERRTVEDRSSTASLTSHTREMARASLPVTEVARLLLELSPPGVSDLDLVARMNRWLEARGLQPYPSGSTSVLKGLYKESEPVRRRNARVVSEILAEYSAARPGRSRAELLADIQRDYPLLKPVELTRYQEMWRSRPQDYPALRAGPRIERERRYLGGWDVERAVLGPAGRDPELAARLARLSQYARIPAKLPVLEAMVADLKGKVPLRKHNLLMVSHLLGTTVALTDALRAAGISVSRSMIVGTPYGSNEAVVATLRKEGFKVRVPQLSAKAYKEAVEKAVREMADRYRRDPRKKPILVLDDGGLVTQYLHSNPELADVLPAFHIVEQTTRGITIAQQTALKVPVLDIPETSAKKSEARYIGQAVAAKVVQALRRQGTSLRSRKIVIMGNGPIGSATARAIKAVEPDAQIAFVEPNARRAATAGRRYEVLDKASAIASADVVIGATGQESLSADDLRQLKNNAIIVSASSKRLEFALDEIQGSARREELRSSNPLVKLPSARYTLGGKSFIALGDGWPINFDGDVEDIAPEQIQITRALMFAGALQVAALSTRFEKNQGLIKLAPATNRRILTLCAPYRRVTYPSPDPERWMDTVRQIAAF